MSTLQQNFPERDRPERLDLPQPFLRRRHVVNIARAGVNSTVESMDNLHRLTQQNEQDAVITLGGRPTGMDIAGALLENTVNDPAVARENIERFASDVRPDVEEAVKNVSV